MPRPLYFFHMSNRIACSPHRPFWDSCWGWKVLDNQEVTLLPQWLENFIRFQCQCPDQGGDGEGLLPREELGREEMVQVVSREGEDGEPWYVTHHYIGSMQNMSKE